MPGLMGVGRIGRIGQPARKKGVVAELADDVAVMYMGNIVEAGTVDDVLRRPTHPYTI